MPPDDARRPQPDAAVDDLSRRGFARWPDLLPPGLFERVQARAASIYGAVEAWQLSGGSSAMPRPLPEGLTPPDVERPVAYVPTADSLALHVLGPVAGSIWSTAEAALAPVFAAEFGGAARRLTAHAWLRRQHPPAGRRSPQTPHGWHQDGGLGFDYLGGEPAAGLLPMLTAWIPLVACGRDAPGLRLEARRRGALIALNRLGPEAAAARIVTPRLAAGEAVLMHGGTLHATASVGAAPRVSVELRWLPRGLDARV